MFSLSFIRDDFHRADEWYHYMKLEINRKDLLIDVYDRLYRKKISDADLKLIVERPSFSPGLRMTAYRMLVYRGE